MKEKPEISSEELKVLQVLYEVTDSWGEGCIPFSYMEDDTKLTRKEIAKACKSLREKDLAHFHRGLMDDDGKVAGSGYCISPNGRAFMAPCDVCGEYATFEYDGKRECDEHYKKSGQPA